MTLMFYESIEGEQSNLGATWFQAASKTGDLFPIPHLIWIYAEYGGTLINRSVQIRVLVDGEERGSSYHTPEVANEYKGYTVFGLFTPTGVEDVKEPHTISLEVRGGHPTQTVKVRRIRLAIMQE